MQDKFYYWKTTALKVISLFFIMCAVYGLLMYFGNDDMTLPVFINDTIIFYFLLINMTMTAACAFTTIPMNINVVLSLGSTRKDAYKGILVFHAILVSLSTIVLLILCLVTPKNPLSLLRGISSYIACLLLAFGFGTFGGVYNLLKGKKLTTMYFFTTLSAIAIPLLLLMFSGAAKILTAGEINFDFGDTSLYITVATIIISIIVYSVSLIKTKKVLAKYEVSV